MPDRGRTSRPKQVRRDVIALAAVWLAMAVLVSPYGDFPINDDWVYAASSRSILAGRFEVYAFSSANLGPQAYWGALFARLFGFSFDVLRLSSWLLGFGGLVALYLLFLRLWKRRLVALVMALTICVNPIYLSLALTFMTDVPFFAVLATSILLIVHGIQSDRRAAVAAGLLLAIVSVTLRQFGVVVLAGFALAQLGRRGIRPTNLVIALLPLVVGLSVNEAFGHWLAESGRKPPGAGIPALLVVPTSEIIGKLKWSMLGALTTTGMLLTPLILLCLPPFRSPSGRGPRLVWALVTATVLILGVLFVQRRIAVPVTENVLNWYGIGPLANGDTLMRGVNLPSEAIAVRWAWGAMSIIAFVGCGCLIAALAVGSRRLWLRVRQRPFPFDDRSVTTSAFLIGTGVSYMAILVLLGGRYILFDRYLLPLLLLVATCVPHLAKGPQTALAMSRGRVIAASLALVGAAAFSVVTTHDYFAWSAVRWQALQGMVGQGISPHRIDGGYEFNGWYLYDANYVGSATKNWWWVDDDEYVAGSGPAPGYSTVQVYPVHRWWPSAGRDVFILRRERVGP